MSRQKAETNLVRYIRSRYEMVDVEGTQGLFNNRCFHNCVQYVLERQCGDVASGLPPSVTSFATVWESIAIKDGQPILHYLVLQDDKWYDVTLGYTAKQFEHYPIRKINAKDYDNIEEEFQRSLDSWTEQFTSWWDRHVIGIERIL